MIFSHFFSKPARPVRLLFSGHDFKFLKPFKEHCRRSGLYEIRVDKHKGHQIDSEADARDHVAWADIIFCEWALGNAVWYSRHKRPGQLLVVRMHNQEVHARDRIDFIYKIDWSKVDRLVMIAPHVYDWVINEFPQIRDRACMIYNPIDAAGLAATEKAPGSEFRLGLVGMVPRMKRLDLAIKILAGLLRHDEGYCLHVKGRRPEEYNWMLTRADEMAWYNNIFDQIKALPPERVIFDPQGDDMAAWYPQIGFILSPSDFEGSHQAVAEGMAAGCIPVIRNWEGSDRIYPPRYNVANMDRAIERILEWSEPARRKQEQDYCRRYSVERFDQAGICDKLESVMIRHIRRNMPNAAGIGDAIKSRAAATLPPVAILGYIAPGYRGGYRIRIEQEIRALIQLGCPVRFICLHPKADAAALRDHADQFKTLGCQVDLVECPRIFEVDVSADTFSPEIQSIKRILDESGSRILHCEALYCARVGSLLKEKCPDVKIAFDVHGITPEEERMSGAHPNRVQKMTDWEQRIFASTDLDVFVSEAMHRYCDGKYDLGRARKTLVPCCISDRGFPKPDDTAPLTVPPDRPVLAYLGTMVAWQCGAEMMRLFGALHRINPELFFMLIVPSGDHAKVRELMAPNGLSEKDLLLAEVPHDQVPACLRQAHAAVMLRRNDPVNQVSSPTKFGEYLAAGCPVILTDGIGDFSSLAAQSGVGISLNPELLNEETWPEAELQRILGFIDQCRANRKTIARRCRNLAWETLLWEPAIERLAAAYRDVDNLR